MILNSLEVTKYYKNYFILFYFVFKFFKFLHFLFLELFLDEPAMVLQYGLKCSTCESIIGASSMEKK